MRVREPTRDTKVRRQTSSDGTVSSERGDGEETTAYTTLSVIDAISGYEDSGVVRVGKKIQI